MKIDIEPLLNPLINSGFRFSQWQSAQIITLYCFLPSSKICPKIKLFDFQNSGHVTFLLNPKIHSKLPKKLMSILRYFKTNWQS